eukprot:8704070-Pyramimonas_sp.AAC.1
MAAALLIQMPFCPSGLWLGDLMVGAEPRPPGWALGNPDPAEPTRCIGLCSELYRSRPVIFFSRSGRTCTSQPASQPTSQSVSQSVTRSLFSAAPAAPGAASQAGRQLVSQPVSQ